jgi:hypothetical protein
LAGPLLGEKPCFARVFPRRGDESKVIKTRSSLGVIGRHQ